MAHDQGHCLRGKSATLAGRVADPLRLHPCFSVAVAVSRRVGIDPVRALTGM
jgi:hypothetical protein